MIAAWMLYTLGIGALGAGAALAADRCCRMLRRPARWAWGGGILGIVLLSSAALVRPPAPVAGVAPDVLSESNARGMSDAAPVSGVARLLGGIDARTRAVVAGVTERAYAAAADAGITRALVVLWIVTSPALLALLVITLRRIARARATWSPHEVDGVNVLVSRDEGPALVGLLRPAIVVPGWLLGEPLEKQRLVVQHEDEHRRAGDHLVLACAFLIAALMPWNAPLWWMLRRTRLAVELDCDARVLRRGAPAGTYGSTLLDIAGRTRVRALARAALADSTTDLERRLIAMTQLHRSPRRTRAAAAALTTLALAGAACATELPTAAAIDEMDVEHVRIRAAQAGVIAERGGDSVVYVIDGVHATEADALRLAPDEIVSIEVAKTAAGQDEHAAAGRDAVISIATKATTRRERVMREIAGASSAHRRQQPLGEPLDEAAAAQAAEFRARLLHATPQRRLRVKSAAPADAPLVIIDGSTMSADFLLEDLRPESIERIEIVKGAAARKQYGDPRAGNGVIRITTKSGGH
ncbi:MAG TPA: M56 family metallopeptidase [Longimicrobiales bacterium]